MAREKYSPYTLWLTPISANGKIMKNDTEKNIKAIPNTSFTEIKASYPQATLVSGTENLGTGSKIRIDGVDFVIIKLGDVSGDGIVDARDSLRILKYAVNNFDIKNEFFKASDLNGDGVVDARDSLRILKYAVGSYVINL